MRALYNSLKQLPEEDRAFLAEKYRVPVQENHKRMIRDDILAEKNGMAPQKYREKRYKLERKLTELIKGYLNGNI